MKKTTSFLFLSILLCSILLTGCGTDSNTYIGTRPDAAPEASGTEAELSNELVYYAYEAMLSLTYATALAENGQLDEVPITKEGDTTTFLFEDLKYRDDVPEARVSGYMRGTDSEEGDSSEVDLRFEGDPEGLKSIVVTSSGPRGQAHDQGTFLINGIERPFLEFTAYFGSRVNQQAPYEEPAS